MTSMQRAFSAKMAVTGDHVYAAEKAGYAFPAQAAAKLLDDPDVVADIQKITLQKLQSTTLKLAQVAHDRLLSDPDTAAGALVGAIKLAYDYGFAVKGAKEGDHAEMTADELRAAADVVRRALADHTAAREADMRTIEHESPQSAQGAPNIFE